MDILKVGAFGIAGVILAMTVKNSKPEFTTLISLAICVCIFVYISAKLEVVLKGVNDLIDMSGIKEEYFKSILKMLGITYVGEFSADICRESGHGAVAGQIEMFAKISIFAMCIPVLTVLVQTIKELM